jgi:hypothetical protein
MHDDRKAQKLHATQFRVEEKSKGAVYTLKENGCCCKREEKMGRKQNLFPKDNVKLGKSGFLKCSTNLEFRWEISVDIINLILKASAQHLISFILHHEQN